MTTVHVVSIGLYDMQDPKGGLNFVFVFDEQPTAEDLITAFESDPVIYRRQDYQQYRGQLQRAIDTYGVPRLNGINCKMVNENGVSIAVPLVTADWYFNAVDATTALNRLKIGTITVSVRPVNATHKVAAIPIKPEKGRARKGKRDAE